MYKVYQERIYFSITYYISSFNLCSHRTFVLKNIIMFFVCYVWQVTIFKLLSKAFFICQSGLLSLQRCSTHANQLWCWNGFQNTFLCPVNYRMKQNSCGSSVLYNGDICLLRDSTSFLGKILFIIPSPSNLVLNKQKKGHRAKVEVDKIWEKGVIFWKKFKNLIFIIIVDKNIVYQRNERKILDFKF